VNDLVCLAVYLVFGASPTLAQDAAQDDGKYVTREEYEKLKKDLEALKVAQDKKKNDQELQEQIDELEKELKAVKADERDESARDRMNLEWPKAQPKAQPKSEPREIEKEPIELTPRP
jgi:hypothetical protein